MEKKRNINLSSLLIRGVLYLFFFLLFLLAILHMPVVQKKIVNAVVGSITKSVNGSVSIDGATINVYQGISLTGILLTDEEGIDTLMTLKSARISPRNTLVTLITQEVALNDIILNGAHIYVNRKIGEESSNWERFIGKKDKDSDETDGGGSTPDISFVRIKDCAIDYSDDVTDEHLSARFASFEVDINELDFGTSMLIDVDRIFLDRPVITYQKLSHPIVDTLVSAGPTSISQDTALSAFPLIKIGHLTMVDGQLSIRRIEESDIDADNLDLRINDLIIEDLDQWSLMVEDISGDMGSDHLPYVSIQRLERRDSLVVVDGGAINLNDSKLKFEGAIEGIAGIGDFNGASYDFRLRPSTVYVKDLFTVLPDLRREFRREPIAYKRLQLEGDFRIDQDKYIGERLSIWLNGHHHFAGSVSFDRADKIMESLLTANVTRLYTNVADLASLSSKFSIPKELVRLETVDFSGSFDGFLNDFVANGLLESPLGRANLDIKFDLSGAREEAISYGGFLELDSFDLRKMTLNDDFGYASAQVTISNGVGEELSSSSADIKAVIDQIEYKDFAYEDAVYEGNLSSKVIDGKFSIEDEELDFQFDGRVDFSDSIPVFDFEVQADKINFCQLNLTTFPCELSFSSDIQMTGNSLSNLDGTATIDKAILKHDTTSLQIDKIEIFSLPGRTANTFSLSSDFIDFDIEGRFNLLNVFQNSLDRLIYNVKEHNEVWKYKLKGGESVDQHYRYSLLLKDATPLFSFLNIDLVQEGLANIRGGQGRQGGSVDMRANIPFLSYSGVSVDTIIINMSSFEGVAMINTQLADIKRGDQSLSKLNVYANLERGIASWSLGYDYDDYNSADLSARSEVRREGYFTTFTKDNVYIDSSRWSITSNDGLGIYPEELDIKDFTLSDGGRFISIKDIDARGLDISMNDFQLAFINSIIDYDKTYLTGSIKSSIKVEDIFEDLLVQGFVNVDHFKVNGDDFGHLALNAKRNAENDQVIDVNLSIEKDTQNLYAGGIIDLSAPSLDVSLRLEDYPMSFFEYIIEDGISETEGTTDIVATLQGPLSDLKLDGEGMIKNAGVKVDFLGAFYRMEDQKVLLDEKFIDFNGVELIDGMGNTAEITGGLRHNLLADIRADLSIASPRFIGLSTTKEDNPLYYGDGVGDIEISFDGPFDAIDIEVVAEVQNLSQLFIPLTSTSYAYDESFIVFTNSQDTAKEEDQESVAEILKERGVDFEMLLTFTPEARVSVIYDEVTGNVLQGTGTGSLQINVKRDGEFTVYGNYDVVSGEYLYTAYGLIAKPFIIRNGGTVTWTGDPFNATLDVTAEYPSLRAPLDNLLQEFSPPLEAADLSARRDIDLTLLLTGQLFTPNIDFNITFPNLVGNVRTYAQNKVRTLRATENGINNQVVGLMVFNNFLPDNNGLAAISSQQVGQSGNNTITQYLTSQLSLFFSEYLSSKLGDDDFISAIDLEIGVAQNTSLLGEEATLFEGLLDVVPDEVQINMRNHFKNDNFVLNLGGNYVRENQTGQANNYVTGDFSLDWYITKDRRLKLRFYGNYDYDDAFSTRRQRYGFGINFRKEFGALSNFQEVLDEMVKKIQSEAPIPPDNIE